MRRRGAQALSRGLAVRGRGEIAESGTCGKEAGGAEGAGHSGSSDLPQGESPSNHRGRRRRRWSGGTGWYW